MMREFLRFFASKREVQLSEVDAIFDEFKEGRCVVHLDTHACAHTRVCGVAHALPVLARVAS